MRKRPGFTLAEVLLSMFILSTSMFILSELQVKSIIRVWYAREDIDRLYLIKKYCYKIFLEPKLARKHTKKVELPPMKVTVDAMPIHKKSSLAPFNKQLQLVCAEGEWDRDTRKRRVHIVTIVPRANGEET